MSYFKTCPRCNDRGYEVLKTHAYCVSCNYSPDLLYRKPMSSDDLPIPEWAAKAVREQSAPAPNNIIPINTKIKKPKITDFEGGAA